MLTNGGGVRGRGSGDDEDVEYVFRFRGVMYDKACAVLEYEANVLITMIDSALILPHTYMVGIKQGQAATKDSHNEQRTGRCIQGPPSP